MNIYQVPLASDAMAYPVVIKVLKRIDPCLLVIAEIEELCENLWLFTKLCVESI